MAGMVKSLLFSAFGGIQGCELIHQVLHHGFCSDVGSRSNGRWARNRSVYGGSSRSDAGGHERGALRFKSGGDPPKSVTFPPFFLLYPGLEICLATGCMRSEGLAPRRLKGEDMALQREWIDELR